MNHKMQSHGVAEWSDTYRCRVCGIILTFSAEDMVSEKEAGTYNLPCKEGQYVEKAEKE